MGWPNFGGMPKGQASSKKCEEGNEPQERRFQPPMTSSNSPQTIVGVDVGGTFTDFVVLSDGALRVHKLLSTPDNPARAVLQGLRELGVARGVAVVHGSTVATNAVLERKGARTALVTTKGFEDVLEIGRQNRVGLYDFMATRPEPLVPPEWRLGAAERVDSEGRALQPLSQADAAALAQRIKSGDIESVAVCFLFSFLNPAHEAMLKAALEEAGAAPYIYLSSEVLPEYREYERTSTTVVNAYIAPVVDRYVGELRRELGEGLRVMQSSGGSVTAAGAMARPVQTISGGPAGGVVGAFHLARAAGFSEVICFDMGGTSTDVSLCPGRVPETTEWSLGGLPIKTAAIDVYSVGAGGGSIARIDAGGALQVGPESAGADPGPACYGKGSLPTVTDANLLLGRLDAERPLGGEVPVDPRRAREAIEPLAGRIGASVEEAAAGVVRVANAHMERAIRVISVERGHDPRDFTLVAFGGAGPMHACELAEALGIPRVLVPLYPGVLSAQGMTIVDISREYSATVMLRGASLEAADVDRALAGLLDQGARDLEAMGVSGSQAVALRSLDMRYGGQSHELTVPYDAGSLDGALAAFHRAHEERYGHAYAGRPVEIVNVRLKMVGAVAKPEPRSHPAEGQDPGRALLGRRQAIFDGHPQQTPLYDREGLRSGNRIPGPALILQYDSTVLLPPAWAAEVDGVLNLVISAKG